jgi:hypothetical protein
MSTNTKAALSATAQPTILSINASYQVAPGTNPVELENDVHCWLEAVHGSVLTVVDLLDRSEENPPDVRAVCRMLYGTQYLVEMVQGALLASSALNARGGAK